MNPQDSQTSATPLTILSLGAGVQSSTMALMAAAGELTPMPDAAIFADTQGEPSSVYKWLDYLETHLPFPVHRVTAGNLAVDEVRIRTSKVSGRRYMKGSIPAFVLNADGTRGLMGRKCTADYKIRPLHRRVRQLLGITRAVPGIVYADIWIGISVDEAHRMKPAKVNFLRNRWPLIEAGVSRSACLAWMAEHGFQTPPRSPCSFCPFHSDTEWRRLRDTEPNGWQHAIDFEQQLQAAQRNQDVLRGIPFLHSSCKPINEVDLDVAPGYRQLDLWGNECEGMCGV